jgi:ADP-heptose:LPS heptosyltransferase
MADWNGAQNILVAEDALPLNPPRRRILALKLDHLGDFIIGLPALERLRASFPLDHITLVCASWNVAMARATGLVDEIVKCDVFPENAKHWDGRALPDRIRFKEIAGLTYDIAIDLRVDDDTRILLALVDARLRCGIGSRRRFPFLDIILPSETSLRSDTSSRAISRWAFSPRDFHTRVKVRTALAIETDFSVTNNHLTWGPYVELPAGRFRVGFDLEAVGLDDQNLRSPLIFDVSAANPATGKVTVLARRTIVNERRAELLSGQVAFDFENCGAEDRIEFRIYTKDRPFQGVLRFLGVKLDRLADGQETEQSRRTPAEMHVGEALSLLVQLVADRVVPAQLASMRPMIETPIPAAIVDSLRPAGCAPPVLIAPFSNSTLRDWPLDHFETLIGYLLECFDGSVGLLGAPSHADAIERIIVRSRNPARLQPLAGAIALPALPALLSLARLVISNNSGIAHVAAATGVPTLAIYSGSHEPRKWGPRGPRTRVLHARVPCAPCGLDRLEDCTHEHQCMKLLSPEALRDQAVDLVRRHEGSEVASDERSNRAHFIKDGRLYQMRQSFQHRIGIDALPHAGVR